MRKFLKKTKLLLKNIVTWKVVDVTLSDEGISTEGLVQSQPGAEVMRLVLCGSTPYRSTL